MNENLKSFLSASERFLSSGERSREAVAALEGAFAEQVEPHYDELPEPLARLQQAFALYSPTGGENLLGYDELCAALNGAVAFLRCA